MVIQNCKTLKAVEIGETVYMRPTGNARFWHGTQIPYVTGIVTKIGRKYFTVNRGRDGIHGGTEEKFTIDGAQCVNDDNYGYILYGSKEAFERDAERERKLCEIKTYFCHSIGVKALSYEGVCKVYDILKEEGLL